MSEHEFQKEVLSKLAAIDQKLTHGEEMMKDHEERLRKMERDYAEAKGRVAIIAAAISAALGIFYVWIGKHL